MRGSTIAGLIGVLAALAWACGPLVPTTTTAPVGSPLTPKQPLMADFDRHLATWQASGITRYAFTYRPMCFCDTTSHLVVADSDAIRIDGVAANQQTGAPAGVPGLFEIVRRAINGDRATVGYDDKTGVPMTMQSDPIANAVDDELSFSVDGWTLDPPDDRVLGEITRARGVWQARSIWTYTMTVKINRDVYTVKVKDGNPTATKGGRKLRPDDIRELPLTVPGLFDLATFSTSNGLSTVTFDRELGYPTRIDIARDTFRVLSLAIP